MPTPSCLISALLAVTACDAGSGARAAELARTGSAAAAASDTLRSARDSGIVRGIYLNRFAAQSPKRTRALIALADSTEVNAFVIDIKDEFGLNYRSGDSLVIPNSGRMGTIPNLPALLDTLEAHGILAIARIVVFKDSVAARISPDRIIRQPDGSAWRDKEGLTWVNPYDEKIWEYNIRVAEEVVRLGFDEVQFDYIRFPEPYRSLPRQVFPDANGRTKTQALARFLESARARINKLGARSTADVFGLVTTVPGALEIGQAWEPLAPVTDVLLPMVYPSHYPRGSFGIARPNADPYAIVHAAIAKARERDLKLGIDDPGHVRPWIQAFSLPRMVPKYGAREVALQKQAIYDAGYDGWVMWHPGSLYDAFIPALEKELVSRRVATREPGLGTRNDPPRVPSP